MSRSPSSVVEQPRPGTPIDRLDTPVAVVDLDRLADNINRLQRYLDAHHIANRPHVKTHKVPAIAHMQLAAGAAGITCQKLGEAQVMADAGVDDIFVPYNIIGPPKLERMVALARQVSLSVTADSETVVRGLSRAAHEAALSLPVLVECDLGMGRCGVQTPAQAVELARVIARSPGLRFGGLMTYPNAEALDDFVAAVRAALQSDGIPVERVSGGGTPHMWRAHTHRELTEHRAGMYIFGDRYTIAAGALRPDERAFGVVATVVSRPTPDRAILDAGSKTLSSDLLGMSGYGEVLEYPDALLVSLSEEHGQLDLTRCERKPAIGERVTVVPNHCCVVVNLFEQLVGVRGGEVETVWPIAARGALQ